jgi:hypothetical protein
MYPPTLLERFCLPSTCDRRRLRQFTAAVLPLEDRRLLSASAMMTQTAAFPDVVSHPNVSTQAFLYFDSSMGTLKEVDVVATGSFTAQFGPSGTSGKDYVLNANSSTPQTTRLTDSADLAAFTGKFRIPISVNGNATTSSSPGQGDLSATITVNYQFDPNYPSLDPTPSPGQAPQSTTLTSSTNNVETPSTTPTSTLNASNTVRPLPSQNLTPVHPVVHHLHARHPRPAVEHLHATKPHVVHTR